MTAGVLLIFAAQAMADSAAISVTTTGGQSDPVAGVPRIFTVSGAAGAPKELFVKYRSAGGAACAPSAYTDSGDYLDYPFRGADVNGSFSLQDAFTWNGPGTYMFCIWIADSDSSVATPITQLITFRSATGTISATVNPIRPRPNQTATITVVGVSEAPEEVFATIRSAGGAGCAPSYDADSGTSLINGTSVNGAFSLQTTTAQPRGTYLMCLWLADSSSDPAPTAGPQPITFTVGSKPRCVVPGFTRRTRLSTMKARLKAHHCGVGKIRYRHSRRVHRGRVVRLRPGPHTRLSAGTPIKITISTGRG